MTTKSVNKANTDKFTIYPYDYIFGHGDDEEKVTLCLTKPFLRMLQSQSARYLWYSSYRLDGQRIELTNNERALLIAGVYSLTFESVDGCLIDIPTVPDEEKECEIINHFHKNREICIMCMLCGTGCGCDGSQTCLPPDQTDPNQNPFPPPTSTEPGDNSQDATWCRRFSWLVAAWVGTIAAVQGGAAAGIELTVDWLSALFGAKMGQMWLFLAGLLQTISSWLISSTTWQGMLDAVNQPEVITQLVCDIYSSSTPSEAKEKFKQTISETNHTWYQGIMLNLWRGIINWNLVFSETAWQAMEAAFPVILSTPLNCTCDGNPPPDPPGQGDEEPVQFDAFSSWWLVPLTMRDIVTADNATLVNGGFQHYYNASHPSKEATNATARMESIYLIDDMTSEGSIYGVTSKFAGFVFEILSVDNAQTGHFANVGMLKMLPEELSSYEIIYAYQENSDLDNVDLASALATIFPTYNIYNKNTENYLEHPEKDTLRYRMVSGGESGLVMNVYAVCHDDVVNPPTP